MHELTWSSDATIFVLVVAAVLVSLLTAWWFARDQSSLSSWRRVVFRSGLIGNTLSISLLCIFLVFALLVNIGNPTYPHLLWAFSFLFWIVLSLATSVLGLFGRGIPRFLVMANGIVLAALWYVLGLANSP